MSTGTIAAQANISQATLFKRFGSKEQLLLAALSPRPPAQLIQLERGPGPGPIRAQLLEVAVQLAQFFRETVPCFAVLRAAGIEVPADHRGASGAPARGRQGLTRWFETAQSQGRMRVFDAHAVAIAFIGMLQARPFREHILDDDSYPGSDEAFVESLIDLLWLGMAPGDAS